MTSEHVCRPSEKEVPMGKMNEVVQTAVDWLKTWSFSIVLALSIFHVGLAYIHVRDSG